MDYHMMRRLHTRAQLQKIRKKHSRMKNQQSTSIEK